MSTVNPMILLNAIKNGQNPQQLVMNILQDQMGNTPMGKNLLDLARQGRTDDITNIARNIVSQRGGNFDKEFSAFCKTLGIK